MATLRFEALYSVSMRCLRLNRAHPAVPLDRRWAWQAGALHGQFSLLLFSFFYSLVAVDLRRGDFSHACENGIFLTVWWQVSFMYGVMLHYRGVLLTLIGIDERHFAAAGAMSAAQRAVVREYALRGRWVTRLWFWSCVVNCGLFPAKALAFTLHSAYRGEFHLEAWFETNWPSPIEEHRHEPLTFSIIFYFHALFGCYAILMYIGFCPLGPIFMLNACGRLDLMIMDIKSVFNTAPYVEEEVSRKVADVVIRIQDMYSYVNLVNEMFCLLYEMNMRGSALMIPVAMYQVMDAVKRGEFAIEYPTFILTAALLSYVPCYYSDLLMSKGEELRVAIYESGWEARFDAAARSSVLVMLTAAARPISVRAVFRVMCLEAFSGLCHESYAIFSVMTAMWG